MATAQNVASAMVKASANMAESRHDPAAPPRDCPPAPPADWPPAPPAACPPAPPSDCPAPPPCPVVPAVAPAVPPAPATPPSKTGGGEELLPQAAMRPVERITPRPDRRR